MGVALDKLQQRVHDTMNAQSTSIKIDLTNLQARILPPAPTIELTEDEWLQLKMDRDFAMLWCFTADRQSEFEFYGVRVILPAGHWG